MRLFRFFKFYSVREKAILLCFSCFVMFNSFSQSSKVVYIENRVKSLIGKSYHLKVDTSNLYSPEGYVVGKSIDSAMYDNENILRIFTRHKFPISVKTKQQTLSETYFYLSQGYSKVLITFYSESTKPSERYYFENNKLIHSSKPINEQDLDVIIDNLKYWQREKTRTI